MRLALVMALGIVSALPLNTRAEAAPCGSWTAAMQEDEGGPRMTASVCVGSGDQPATLSVTCSATEFSMEYSPLDAAALPPDGNMDFKATFTFSDGKQRADLTGQFAAMNGVMAFDWKRNGPLTGVLKSDGTLTIEDASKHITAAHFPLIGAKAAFAKLEKTCK